MISWMKPQMMSPRYEGIDKSLAVVHAAQELTRRHDDVQLNDHSVIHADLVNRDIELTLDLAVYAVMTNQIEPLRFPFLLQFAKPVM